MRPLDGHPQGWRLPLLLAGAWMVLVLFLGALEARGNETRASLSDDPLLSDATLNEEMKSDSDSGSDSGSNWDSPRLKAGEGAARGRLRERWRNLPRAERAAARRQLTFFRRALPEFSRPERRKLLLHAMQLPSAERLALRERLRGIEELEPSERERFVSELRELIVTATRQSDRFNANLRRWQKMSEAEREALRGQMKRFRALPIEERKRLLDGWVPPDEGDAASPTP